MASHTLLDCVNEVLKRAAVVDTANTLLLTSLTQSNVQTNIDIAIQVVNEGIDDLYWSAEVELPSSGGESTITLVTGQREYAGVGSIGVKLLWPLVNRVNLQYIWEWMGSYESFLNDLDPQQVFTGQPNWAMISPITGLIRLDRAPDASVNGFVYTYEYIKDTALALATDQVPFSNVVFRAMVPVWFQLYNRRMRNDFDQASYAMSIGRAARLLPGVPMKTHYSPRG